MGARFFQVGLFLLVAALTSAGSSQANDKTKLDCDNATATVELNACAEKDFDAADAELNKVYAEALKAIPEIAGEAPYDAKGWETALRASQRAWLTFRDAECNDHIAMFWTGGSGATSDIIGCKTDMTKARTKTIQERYMEH